MNERKKDYKEAAGWLQDADAILVTASNGLSIAEGYHIFADNAPFQKYFGKFRQKYGVDCLIRGVFTPMTGDDHREYMETVHTYLIDDYGGSDVMKNLLRLVEGKPYFIVTSNADTHFQMNGFDKGQIFEVEGNFDGLEEGSDQWKEEEARFQNFVRKYAERKLVLLELGIGSRNQLIKAPTMRLAGSLPAWRFITMNLEKEILVPEDLADRSIALAGDIGAGLQKLLKETD